ncbi:MAG: hypothetical protein HYR74_13470 [Candidatus Eisenbacteria bacterium]|nr:hypothetical protein [Candidatus Eisenbacteria bacterium]
MAHWLRTLLPEPVAESLRAWRADRRDARDWRAYRAAPVTPPPHAVKARAVIEHGRRFGLDMLIETGTYEGEMARKASAHFRRVVTIELDPGLARAAERRLARLGNVEVLCGDSARVLPQVLAALREPALFWLDGHFSGVGTARGDTDTPLAAELEAIARHPVAGHVVLIDDARLLGTGEYPSLEAIHRIAGAWRPDGAIEVADDSLRLTPAAPAHAAAGAMQAVGAGA